MSQDLTKKDNLKENTPDPDRCYGVITTSKATYKGYFLNGLREDKCAEITLSNGLTIKTSWKNGLCIGVIDFVLSTGEIYTGAIDNSQPFGSFMPHGSGELKTPQNHPFQFEFKGNFVAGQIKGEGTRILGDSTKYEGSWEKGLYHGKGKLTYPNGDYYDGVFHEGSPQGKGRFVQLSPARVYEGDWRAAKRNGRGVYNLDGFEVYSGEFLDNQYHGNGRLHLGGGSFYIGQFKKGVPHSNIESSPTSGDNFAVVSDKIVNAAGEIRYESATWENEQCGRWVNGHMVGVFRQYLPGGEVRTGIWNRELVRYLHIRFADGNSYSGGFVVHDIAKLHLPHGQGTKLYQGAKIEKFEGYFSQGKPDCDQEGVIKYKDGSLYAGLFSVSAQGFPQPHGFGNMKHKPTGWEYWGEYSNGQREGFGELFVPGSDNRITGKWEKGKYLKTDSDEKVNIENDWKDPKSWNSKVPIRTLSLLVEYKRKKVEWAGEVKELETKEIYPFGYGTLTIYRGDELYAKAFAFWEFELSSGTAKITSLSKSSGIVQDSFIIDEEDQTISGPLEISEDLVRIKT